MIKSMTGFGRGKHSENQIVVECDLRSVNHRFLETVIRVPKNYAPLESNIRELLSAQLGRGRVDCFVNVSAVSSKMTRVKVDKDLVKGYADALARLAKTSGLAAEYDLQFLAGLEGVIRTEDEEADLEKFWAVMEKSLIKAINNLVRMRKKEGKALAKDIRARCKTIAKNVVLVKKEIPKIHEAFRQRMEKRFEEIHGQVETDPWRLSQELSTMLMRMDVSEELTRLDAHLEQLSALVDTEEPIGRKMDFLLQECHREINTLGNKVQGMEVSRLVVDIKSELEKIREQVQNVE